jgi:CrcB protein
VDVLLVGIGGALGAVARYELGRIISKRSGSAFPAGTFVINISGALLLGILSSINAGDNIYLLFGDGFSGAYTTFSTFMFEGFHLFHNHKKLNALVYIVSSLLLGVIGYAIGYEIVRLCF